MRTQNLFATKNIYRFGESAASSTAPFHLGNFYSFQLALFVTDKALQHGSVFHGEVPLHNVAQIVPHAVGSSLTLLHFQLMNGACPLSKSNGCAIHSGIAATNNYHVFAFNVHQIRSVEQILSNFCQEIFGLKDLFIIHLYPRQNLGLPTADAQNYCSEVFLQFGEIFGTLQFPVKFELYPLRFKVGNLFH